jgi:hypothetical protein
MAQAAVEADVEALPGDVEDDEDVYVGGVA